MLKIQKIRLTKKNTQSLQKKDNIENILKNLENDLKKDIDEINQIKNEDNFLNENELNESLE